MITPNFTATPTLGVMPLTVDFVADLVVGAISYIWDFGDGTSGSGQSVSHEFTRGGYTITLTVTTATDSGSIVKPFLISVAYSTHTTLPADFDGFTVANVDVIHETLIAPATVIFTAWLQDPDTEFTMNFGDGTPNLVQNFNAGNVHVYNTPGVYTVSLVTVGITGSNFAWNDYVHVIANPNPVPDPTPSPSPSPNPGKHKGKKK